MQTSPRTPKRQTAPFPRTMHACMNTPTNRAGPQGRGVAYRPGQPARYVARGAVHARDDGEPVAAFGHVGWRRAHARALHGGALGLVCPAGPIIPRGFPTHQTDRSDPVIPILVACRAARCSIASPLSGPAEQSFLGLSLEEGELEFAR